MACREKRAAVCARCLVHTQIEYSPSNGVQPAPNGSVLLVYLHAADSSCASTAPHAFHRPTRIPLAHYRLNDTPECVALHLPVGHLRGRHFFRCLGFLGPTPANCPTLPA